jgi:hypothetical protein
MQFINGSCRMPHYGGWNAKLWWRFPINILMGLKLKYKTSLFSYKELSLVCGYQHFWRTCCPGEAQNRCSSETLVTTNTIWWWDFNIFNFPVKVQWGSMYLKFLKLIISLAILVTYSLFLYILILVLSSCASCYSSAIICHINCIKLSSLTIIHCIMEISIGMV